MARERSQRNGNGRLEEAMTKLAHSQSDFQSSVNQSITALHQSLAAMNQAIATEAQNQTAFLARIAELERQMAETDRIDSERFARIEVILLEHSRILRDLPDAVRDKIGFKGPESLRG